MLYSILDNPWLRAFTRFTYISRNKNPMRYFNHQDFQIRKYVLDKK